LPDVVEERVYVATPPESPSGELCVEPSTRIVTEPVGEAGIPLEAVVAGATVIVMKSLVPTVGFEAATASVVVEASSVDAAVVGQAFSRLLKSSEPRPLASSYPLVAAYWESPAELQYETPAVHMLLPLVMSWNADAYVVAFEARE
jgi:hypothetical protein